MDAYLQACRVMGYSDQTIKARYRCLSLLPRPLLECSAEDLLKVVGKPRRASSKRTYLKVLRAAWRDHRQLGWTDKEWPLRDWQLPPMPLPEPRPYSQRQVDLLLTMEDDISYRATILGLYAGLRVSEVLAVREDDFDGERLWVRGKARDETLFAHPRVADVMDGWVPIPGVSGSLSNRWQRHARRVGVSGRFHRLRTTYACRLVEYSDVLVASKALRHRHLSSTQHYVLAADARVRDAIAML